MSMASKSMQCSKIRLSCIASLVVHAVTASNKASKGGSEALGALIESYLGIGAITKT